MDLILGVDVGQRQEPSGLCVVEVQERMYLGREVDHFVVRYLERIDAGAPFPRIARRVGTIVDSLYRSWRSSPDVYVDATGLGDPVMDLINAELSGDYLRPVYFNHGDRRTVDGLEIRLGKAWLVTRVQTLLQSDHLHLPRTPEVESLTRDLLDYEIRVDPDANERYGAFRVGRHDDLVTALGLAVQAPPQRIRIDAIYG